MDFAKSVYLNSDVCYALNKCCKIPGYAYEVGYININAGPIETIYQKRINFNRNYYVEVNVKFQITDDPRNQTCWVDFTLFSCDNVQLTVSEPSFELTGIHQFKFEENIFELFLKEDHNSLSTSVQH
jgi:hypothetical protein